jgi:photosystem II stability/assembly factor-like uncharacterized protein
LEYDPLQTIEAAMKTRTILITLLVLSSAPRLAFSQWSWAHPQPQGHTLHDVVFLDDNTAIAVGEVGTIVVTHDGGNTWALSSPLLPFAETLNSVERVDANRAVAVGNGGVILMTPNQGANWFPVAAPFGTGDLFDVSFGDATHGIAVGSGVSLSTSNGGFFWLDTPAPTMLRSVDMISATEAFAVGSVTSFDLQHTTDGGLTWSPMGVPSSGNRIFAVVDFLDAQHGAVATPLGVDTFNNPAPPTCYVTSDGGATWSASTFLSANYDYAPGEILYPDAGTIMLGSKVQCCVTSAFDPPAFGDIEISTNTGTTFTNSSNGRPIFGLARNSAGITLLVGQNGRMLRRSAGGAITNIGGPAPTQGYDLSDGGGSSSFFNSQVGVVLNNDGYGYMQGGSATYFAVTQDGGQTWIHPTGSGQCNDVVCLSATEMIGVGSGIGPIGAVLRSTNGGMLWSNIWGQSSPSNIAAVAAGSSTHAVAVGGSSALVIDNGGVTVVPTGGAGLIDVAFASPSVVLAVGTTDRRSNDGGSTWGSISGPSTNVTALDFANPITAFGITPAGILRSDDAGDTWTPVATGAVSGLKDIAFSDSDHGMAVGAQILMTNSGGTTWGTIVPPTSYPLNHVTMVSPNFAFVSGTQSILFRYGESPVPTLIRAMDAAAVPFGAKLSWDVVPDNNLSSFSITRSSGSLRETIASDLAVSARSFSDDGLMPGKTYEYQLVAVDRDGSYTQSMPVKVTIPKASVELLPNQPNPFNPVTSIRFVVPEKMPVVISIHDVAGRLVATLSDEVREPGVHELTWNARGVASGVYFARMHAGKTDVSRKMVLLK